MVKEYRTSAAATTCNKKKIPQKEGNIQKAHKEYINENIECLTKLIQDTGSWWKRTRNQVAKTKQKQKPNNNHDNMRDWLQNRINWFFYADDF